MYVTPLAPGRAVVLAQPLDRVDDLLRRLRKVLFAVVTAGVAVVFGVGWAVARSALAPVRLALRRSLASQRQLVADASHELRTPLTSLPGQRRLPAQ
jgi:two-component system sensor histidine kinase MprB